MKSKAEYAILLSRGSIGKRQIKLGRILTWRVTGNPEVGLFGVKVTYNAHPGLLAQPYMDW